METYKNGVIKTRNEKGRFIRVVLSDEERFWSKVEKTKTCWLWRGTLTLQGYGKFYLGDKKYVQSTRYVWLLTYGKYPENDMCHICDNPPCVNPSHLFDGTARDNVLDALQKGRMNLAGRNNPVYKLNMEKANEIRHLYKTSTLTYREIAKIYGVAYKTIDQIIGYDVYKPKGKLEDLTRVKTHCIHGHEYTPENTFNNSKGRRECRICRRENRREEKRKARLLNK